MSAAVACGLGAYVPPRVVTNASLAKQLDTSDEWIVKRTGIRQRYVVDPGTATSDLAVAAGRRALASAGVERVDLVVLATSTPDRRCPATAPLVADRLGLSGVAAFDVVAVCTGFVYALATAAGMMAVGLGRSALVIGADTFSTVLDPSDRTTRAIFGDGAGAVVLRAGDADEPGALLGFDLGSDGANAELISIAAGGRGELTAERPGAHYFAMRGREVFFNAVLRMSESTRRVLRGVGWAERDVDRLVAHQANVRILHAVATQLGMDRERLTVNLDRVGNTVAASIPLALHDATSRGDLLPGHRVVLTGFGGGLTWGSVALRWPTVPVQPLFDVDDDQPQGSDHA
jgi:3-oxoacyl-[acyl-carrier-protein] synthase III